LEELPIGSKSLDLAYEKAIQRIQGQKPGFVELAWRVISWITCAKRPLTSTELQHALAVELNDVELCEDNLEDIDEMVSSCAGLVTVDREGDIIRLIHHTTQRYFEQTQNRWFPNADTDIAITCVTYLSFKPFARGRCKTDRKYEKRLQLHKLYHYAAHQWGHHARNGSDSYHEVAGFLRKKAQVEAASQVLMAIKHSSTHIEYSQQMPEKLTGLHLAAYFGVHEAAQLLVETENINARDSYGRTPLSWAAEHGHEAIVRLLLDSDKIEVDAKDRNHETPLFWAAQYGDKAIVKLILDTRKVKVDRRDKRNQTPLLCAARCGHEAVVKLLLDTGEVEVDAQGENGQTPLSWAAKSGHSAVVQLLLNSGKAELDAKDRCSQTPLSWAAEHGHKTVVKLLLDSGKVDADAADIYGRTPLLLAAQNGHEAIVKLLLDSGKVNADARDKIYSKTPLSWAAHGGFEAVVKLLLDTGKVVVDGKDHLFGQTPLSWAAQHGHEAVVKLLLDTGEVEVDGKNTYGQTPLSLAADNGYVTIVKLLLNISEAEVNTKYISEQTWISLTTRKPRKAHETLTNDSVRRQTPLMRAVKKGRKAVINLLRNASKNDADVG
jgi:ankyrin repeat protein